MNLADLRTEYKSQTLDEAEVLPNPIQQFEQWMKESIDAEIPEPTAMHLSTIGLNRRPSGRVVLLKGIEDGGFVFYTNYDSRKGQELEVTPFASITFYWIEMERQVRIEGAVRKAPEAMSDAYFNSRPKASRLGAHASPQSNAVENREFLEQQYKILEEKYEGTDDIERPNNWGGYIVQPDMIEFWQGRPSRLHDRIRYTKDEGDLWIIERLAP